eukprot:6213386-Pleurochrysis_carterae.AAC.1
MQHDIADDKRCSNLPTGGLRSSHGGGAITADTHTVWQRHTRLCAGSWRSHGGDGGSAASLATSGRHRRERRSLDGRTSRGGGLGGSHKQRMARAKGSAYKGLARTHVAGRQFYEEHLKPLGHYVLLNCDFADAFVFKHCREGIMLIGPYSKVLHLNLATTHGGHLQQHILNSGLWPATLDARELRLCTLQIDSARICDSDCAKR